MNELVNNFTFNFNILRITVTQILPNIVPKLGPKCPFSSFLRIIFGVFAKTFFKTVQTFKMGHSLKLPVKKNKFLQCGTLLQILLLEEDKHAGSQSLVN